MKEKISGEKTVYYSNINSIDYQKYDKDNRYSSGRIILNTNNSEPIGLGEVFEDNFKQLNDTLNVYKNSVKESTNPNEKAMTSNVDELMKYAELYEKGLLTKEEFESKKKELL